MAFLRSKARIFRAIWTATLATFVAAALLQSVPASALAATQPSAEYQIKAVFLFNFAQFVEWPSHVFKGPTSPVVIGVLGDDPFGPYLDDLVKGEKVGARPVVIRRYHTGDDIGNCHLLYVSQSESGRIDRITAELQGKNVLTLGDGAAFCRQGGMVGFVTDHGKVRLRINLKAAIAADLTISSKLLTPATIVTGDK